ncbi:MAG TPA: hypothetical protein VGH33_05370 [Isosphaeraceae bacterium]|jgi:hypothetical protein
MSAADPKAAATTAPHATGRDPKPIRIFHYPKIVFIFPTLVMSFVCGIGMLMIHDDTIRPSRRSSVEAKIQEKAVADAAYVPNTPDFKSPQNVLALSFLIVFTFNMLILSFDFPRFTVVAGILVITTLLFFLLWLSYLTDWLHPLVRALDKLYLVANAAFYFTFGFILLMMYGIIFVTRWLDYWEFLPNEILHHHGPWSDLERFPTTNLKFDKEIPDIFEHFLFGSGRLIFHVQNEQKSIVLDNVMHINRKEQALKQIMSRMEVRISPDAPDTGAN